MSPSSSKRWLTCPPSARLNQKLVDRFGDKASDYAEEGTKAHSLCELKLRLELGEINKFNFDAQRKALGGIPAEMERNTDRYADTVLEKYYSAKKLCPDARLFVEQRLDMSRWIPQCSGTSDAVIVSDQILEVCDYKNGAGVPVSAINNTQARCYGLGALDAFGEIYGFPIIRNVIIQPKLDSVTEETLTREELLSWGDEIKPVAEQAWRGEGEFNPGDHCKFCHARAICKARAMDGLSLFQYGFETPGVLSDEAIPEILKVASTAKAWIKDVEEYALNQALRGQEWPGYKLVKNKRPARVFRSDEEAEEQLIRAGYTPEQYMETRMKSVAEVEKLLGKKAFSALLGAMTVQGEGKLALVPEDDKRIEFESADVAFADMIEKEN